jgi:hypothetical protein
MIIYYQDTNWLGMWWTPKMDNQMSFLRYKEVECSPSGILGQARDWKIRGRCVGVRGKNSFDSRLNSPGISQVFSYDSRLYSSRISQVFSVLASESSWVGMEKACVADAAWIPAHQPAPLQPKDPLLLLLHSVSLSLSLSPKEFCSLCRKQSRYWKSYNGCWPIACQDIRLWHSKLIT